MLKIFFQPFIDLLLLWYPIKRAQPKRFAFLIHLRDINDLYRKFPFFKKLPESFVLFLTKFLWPITVSKITGLKNQENGEPMLGWVIGIPLTAQQMLEDRTLALKKIREAAILSEKKGARVIGLGALTASLSKGGLDLVETVGVSITTGHAYTIYNVANTLLSIMEATGKRFSDSHLAVVGASGSIGSGATRFLSRNSFAKITLIDVERKNSQLISLQEELSKMAPLSKISISNTINDTKDADLVITATNAPETLVRAHNLKSGAIVIDDAQPSDIDEEVFNRSDVLVLEAGAVRTPGISANFNIDLQSPEDNFSCMAELLILAAQDCASYKGLGPTTLQQVDEIAALGEKMGFKLATFQNKNESISEEKIEHIRQLSKK